MNTQWHFLQRCWASGKMLSILRSLILNASFPDLMELCDKRVREIGHHNNLSRKEGRSSSILHEINKGFTHFSTWEPQVDQLFGVGLAPLYVPIASGGQCWWSLYCSEPRLSPVDLGQGLLFASIYPAPYTVCAQPMSHEWMLAYFMKHLHSTAMWENPFTFWVSKIGHGRFPSRLLKLVRCPGWKQLYVLIW